MTRNDELMRKGTALLKAFSHADDSAFAIITLHKYTQLTNIRRGLSVEQRDADAMDRYNHICAGGRGWFIANGEVFDVETHKPLTWAKVVEWVRA